jgi:hypothetical protein
MSEIKIDCPHCTQHIQCDESYGGKQINCPQCQQAFVVPQVLQAKPSLQITPSKEKAYLVNSDGKQSGPFTIEELKSHLGSGELAWEDLAWCEGMSNWQPLSGIIAPKGLGKMPPPVPSSRRSGNPSLARSTGKPEGQLWCYHLMLLMQAAINLIFIFFCIASNGGSNSSPNWIAAAIILLINLLINIPAYLYQQSRSWPNSGGSPPGKWWMFCLLLLGFFPAAIIYRRSSSWRELTSEQSVAVLAIGIGLVVVVTVVIQHFYFR